MVDEPAVKIQRRPYPSFNAFRPFIIDELRRRKYSYPTPVSAPFVRLTSCKLDPVRNFVFFTLGLHGFNSADVNIFDSTYGGGRDIVGYAYDLNSRISATTVNKRLVYSDELSAGDIPKILNSQLSPELRARLNSDRERIIDAQNSVYAEGAHPTPGIIDVSVKRSGIGMPMVARVKWVCYNRTQLEFLRNHFMLTGGHVCLEFGQNFHDKQIVKTLNFANVDEARVDIANSIIQGRKYIIDKYVMPNDGNYDLMCGVVSNFEFTLDSQTGIYEVTTNIVSAGEEMSGLDSHFTRINKEEPKDSNDAHRPTTFADFYRLGGSFDYLIEEALNAKSYNYVANYKASFNFIDVKVTNRAAFSSVSSNPQDYRFISWEFFTNKIIPQMMEMIQTEFIKVDIKNFIKFYVDPAIDAILPVEEQSWVGDNSALRSTNPETMLIIKKSMPSGTVDPEFATAGYFDDFAGADGFRGKLSQGIWLNVGMIRSCFLETNNFQSAIKSLLIRMNNAVAGYWRLQLFFDDDDGTFKIVDAKYGDSRDGMCPSFYKFNIGGKGELLNLNFDTAYPPEMVAQMRLFAQFKTEGLPRQTELLNKYPALGTTSTYMFSLNWTNLVDIISEEIAAQRKTPPERGPIGGLDTLLSPLPNGTTIPVNDRLTNRVSGGDVSMIGPAFVTNKGSPNVGYAQGAGAQAIAVTEQKNFSLGTKDLFGNPRTSVTPVQNTAASSKLIRRSAPFDRIIDAAGQKYNIDPNLIRAFIAAESGFDPTAVGPTDDWGLMQVTMSTARGFNFKGTPAQLQDPTTNIDLGTRFISDLAQQLDNDPERIISGYNGGTSRPELGFGAILTKGVTLKDNTKNPPGHYFAPAGQFGNQPYVNTVMGYYNQFRTASGGTAYVGSVTNGTLNPDVSPSIVGVSGADAAARKSQEDEIKRRINEINVRFGSPIIKLIATSPSVMVNEITRNGYIGLDKSKPLQPNSFVGPFPTTTSVGVQILGVSGISISDAFLVDRLPFIFEKYGVFQTTEINETITTGGWITNIQGYYKVIWMNGDGPRPEPTV